MSEDITKAEKLARALHNVLSGGRSFNRQLAAQARDELQRLEAENRDLKMQAIADGAQEQERYEALRAERERDRVAEERERVAAGLDHEADVCPCEEDAKVIRECALLVRADFSYDEAERIAISNGERST